MNAHVERLIRSYSLKPALLGDFIAWLKSKAELHRIYREQQEQIRYLLSLGPDLLEDMGLDASKLGSISQPLAAFHPHAIAAALFTRGPSGSLPDEY